jgi:hypothetical protein
METDHVFEARIRDSRAKVIASVIGVLFVAMVGINLLPSDDSPEQAVVAVPSTPTSTPFRPASPTPRPSTLPKVPGIRRGDSIDPGGYYIAWPEMRIRLTMPEGWFSTASATTITKESTFNRAMTVTISANPADWVADAPSLVATDVCSFDRDVTFAAVGPTAADLTAALAAQSGYERTGPVDVLVGGFPGKRIDMTGLDCPNIADGRVIWLNARADAFELFFGGTVTIYVVDVNGDRLVISSRHGGSPKDIAELEALVASIKVEPAVAGVRSPRGDLAIGTYRWAVGGIPLSFGVSTPGWEPHDGISINKDAPGPQGAEAIIYWTRFPDSDLLDLCSDVLGHPPSAADLAAASAVDLADAMAAAPGTELLEGPSPVKVGDRPATRVVLKVREDMGCDPGFFFGWDEVHGGAFWGTARHDQVTVWIVDMGSTSIIVGSAESPDSSPELSLEIRNVVESTRFE